MNYDFARINQSAEAIRDWSLTHKQDKNRDYVSIPVLDVPFLQALQVDISHSQDQGLKVNRPLAQNVDDLQALMPLPFDRQAFQPILGAIDLMPEEKVLYKMPNLLNILEGILPFEQTIKLTRKHPDLFKDLTDQVIAFMHEIMTLLDQKKVAIIYLFDSFGSFELLGPSFYKRSYGVPMVQLLSQADRLQHSKLALAKSIAMPLQQCYGLKEDPGSSLYIASQDQEGSIRLLKAVYIQKEKNSCN